MIINNDNEQAVSKVCSNSNSRHLNNVVFFPINYKFCAVKKTYVYVFLIIKRNVSTFLFDLTHFRVSSLF